MEKKITWSIHTNYARLPIENPYIISDVLDASQEYVADSLKVFTYEVDKDGTIINETTMAPELYQVVYPSEENGNKITVSLVGKNEKIISVGIRFKTQFKNELISGPSVRNNATFQSGETSFGLNATVNIPYGGKLADKKGVQAGDFNERADWTVYLNPNRSKLSQFVLTDSPDLNSVLLKETFEVVLGVVDINGNITKSTTVLEKTRITPWRSTPILSRAKSGLS